MKEAVQREFVGVRKVTKVWSKTVTVCHQLVGVSLIVSHHGYNTRSKESDVALLKLQQALVFNQFVRPIDVWMSPLPLFTKCTVTGWGSTRESEDASSPFYQPQSFWRLMLSLCPQTGLEFTDCRK